MVTKNKWNKNKNKKEQNNKLKQLKIERGATVRTGWYLRTSEARSVCG